MLARLPRLSRLDQGNEAEPGDVGDLRERLAEFGRRVVLQSKVDPGIIGGVVTRLGSTVYDGSVTTQLAKMKQTLIEAGQ